MLNTPDKNPINGPGKYRRANGSIVNLTWSSAWGNIYLVSEDIYYYATSASEPNMGHIVFDTDNEFNIVEKINE